MKLNQAFDARSVRPADPDGGAYLPVGLHPAFIIGNEIKENSQKHGHLIILKMRAADGPAKGMEADYRINYFYNNPGEPEKSAKTREIATQQLSAVCHATGVYQVEELDALNGKPLILVVESQNDAQFPNRTNIVGVADMNGDKPGQPGVKVRQREAAPIQAAAAPAQPWTPPATAQAAPPPAAGQWGPASAPATPAPAPGIATGVAGFAPPAAPAVAPAAAPAWGGQAAQTPAPPPNAAGVPAWAQAR